MSDEYLKLYLIYKALNKLVAKFLRIRRDRTAEHYLLLNVVRNILKINILEKRKKENYIYEKSKGYTTHYTKELSFKDLDYVVCRTMVEYFILEDENIITSTVNSVDNAFCKAYVNNKIKELKEVLLLKSKMIIQKRVAL